MGSKHELEKMQVPSRATIQHTKSELNVTTPKVEGHGGKVQPLGVPTLNLSTLKHVREYTRQQTILLDVKNAKDSREGAGPQPQPKRPNEPAEDNQWYHYSTKLELNVKFLRKQIDEADARFRALQEQLDQERLQKDKLQQLNLKLARFLKMQKGSKDRSITDLGANRQYQTFDGRQSQQKLPLAANAASQGQMHIQIHNLSHLYHSNQFYTTNPALAAHSIPTGQQDLRKQHQPH